MSAAVAGCVSAEQVVADLARARAEVVTARADVGFVAADHRLERAIDRRAFAVHMRPDRGIDQARMVASHRDTPARGRTGGRAACRAGTRPRRSSRCVRAIADTRFWPGMPMRGASASACVDWCARSRASSRSKFVGLGTRREPAHDLQALAVGDVRRRIPRRRARHPAPAVTELHLRGVLRRARGCASRRTQVVTAIAARARARIGEVAVAVGEAPGDAGRWSRRPERACPAASARDVERRVAPVIAQARAIPHRRHAADRDACRSRRARRRSSYAARRPPSRCCPAPAHRAAARRAGAVAGALAAAARDTFEFVRRRDARRPPRRSARRRVVRRIPAPVPRG